MAAAQCEKVQTLDTLRPRKQLPLIHGGSVILVRSPCSATRILAYLDVETHRCSFGYGLRRGRGRDVALSASSQEHGQLIGGGLWGEGWHTMHKNSFEETVA